MRRIFIFTTALSFFLVFFISLFWPPILVLLTVILPISALGVYDMLQKRHTLLRNFPVIGRIRKMMEKIRPMVQQYFIEQDIEGAPINRIYRSVVYQRAKQELSSVPYGTKYDVYRIGYEWIGHSLAAKNLAEINRDIRLRVGGPECKMPYQTSILNISAMSYGSLSARAIEALNGGAKLGGFAHNTGEGGISKHHLAQGGDLIWQIGTGYFGCRNVMGFFDSGQFHEKATLPQVKMIELKLSQGAKPGHGGILPARKNTPEIASIRGVEPYTQIDSPATHSAFSNPIELMLFIQKLRDLSGGKPVGFKLCIGQRSEFIAICKAMLEIGIKPDFITVDGSEGGTGAAPLEYTNSIGMPLVEALAFVSDCLIGFDFKRDIKIFASGKVFTGFHVVKLLAIGADVCNCARGMMLALGCIQSLQCNKDTCPTGITTHDPQLMNGLVVADKKQRVANFHRETVSSVAEIISAAGLQYAEELNRGHIFRRVSPTEIKDFEAIYPSMTAGELLGDDIPESFVKDFNLASAHMFASTICPIN